jgi:hypothetical protein
VPVSFWAERLDVAIMIAARIGFNCALKAALTWFLPTFDFSQACVTATVAIHFTGLMGGDT